MTSVELESAIKELRAMVEYARFVDRLRHTVTEHVRPDARALIVSKGDSDLLQLASVRAAHFPQAVDGGFAGSYPADAVAAVAHLEALRQEGFDTLVIPASAAWWLEYYAGLASHLRRRCALLHSGAVCSIFDLQPLDSAGAASVPVQAWDVLQEAWQRLGRQPDVLNWGTSLEIATICSDHSVATVAAGSSLPHFDRSIDVVFVGRHDECARAEARRVASAAVVVLDDDRIVETEWLVDAGAIGGNRMPPAPPSAADGLPLTLRGPRGDEWLAWIAPGVTPIADWFGPVAALFERDAATGAVGGRLLDFGGRLHHAGGVVLADASVVPIGQGSSRPDDPRYRFVREVDWCSSLFMVTSRRAFEDAGGFDLSLPPGPYRDADFGLRLHGCGYSMYFQPESLAVCSRRLTTEIAVAATEPQEPERRRTFAERWKSVLRSRPAALDAWGTSAGSRLALVSSR